MDAAPEQVTQVLAKVGAEDKKAAEKLLPLVVHSGTYGGWMNLGAPLVATGFPLTISDTYVVQSSAPRFYRLTAWP